VPQVNVLGPWRALKQALNIKDNVIRPVQQPISQPPLTKLPAADRQSGGVRQLTICRTISGPSGICERRLDANLAFALTSA